MSLTLAFLRMPVRSRRVNPRYRRLRRLDLRPAATIAIAHGEAARLAPHQDIILDKENPIVVKWGLKFVHGVVVCEHFDHLGNCRGTYPVHVMRDGHLVPDDRFILLTFVLWNVGRTQYWLRNSN